ncbi:hypothetical protein HDU91_003702 [Kappamyces sp. JEL0680]|nr:hypothetical protein HDU91_003702 [Kappamyces sp. JEL0680]
MLRTSSNPLNQETAANILFHHDVTPIDNCYIRCHGNIPNLNWNTQVRFQVEDNPGLAHDISMDDLVKYEKLSVQTVMACDGNRRKELNNLPDKPRTNGFDWSCLAVSNMEFAGSLLREVLLDIFGKAVIDDHSHVHFVSHDVLFNGHYGTSLPLSTLDTVPVLLAYEMNGSRLKPEHGFPVRTAIPGYVGGRTVKWLSHVILSKHESCNSYHLHDNSVYPSHVTSSALLSKYLHDQDNKNPSALYELNLNSAILFPEHDSSVSVPDKWGDDVAFQGYAYDGGGRKISKIELTMDDGKTWVDGSFSYAEGYKPYNGKWYALVKWECRIPMRKLIVSKQVAVRAWNSSMNTQPEHYTWNLLGMMNNAWYRVSIDYDAEASTISFVHPVSLSARQRHGWLEDLSRKRQTRYVELHTPPGVYDWQEVSKHNQKDDCWVVIDNKIYDLTDFLNMHPGGVASILAHAGTDVTGLFYDIHSEDTHMLKAAFVLGTLASEEDVKSPSHHSHLFRKNKRHHPRVTPHGKRVALSSSKWEKVQLKHREDITHDTRRFVFAFQDNNVCMWLPWGKHVNIAVDLHDRMVVRAYSPVKPILEDEDDGTFELIVKIYFPSEGRPGGELTQILEDLKIGDTVSVKGPEGILWYAGNKTFSIHGHYFYCKTINLFAGGTGITPFLAILRALFLAEKRTDVQVCLIFANKTARDILCRDELAKLAKSTQCLSICHVISDAKDVGDSVDGFPVEHGQVCQGILQKHIFQNQQEEEESQDYVANFICGPPAFVSKGVVPALLAMGFDEEQIYEF